MNIINNADSTHGLEVGDLHCWRQSGNDVASGCNQDFLACLDPAKINRKPVTQLRHTDIFHGALLSGELVHFYDTPIGDRRQFVCVSMSDDR
jgi:hypothetical protein